MPEDNTTYDSLENAYDKIQEFFDNNQIGAEHSEMILKHRKLRELLDELDIQIIEGNSDDLNALHEKFKAVKLVSNKLVEDLNDDIDSIATVAKVISGLDKVISKVADIIA